MIWGRQNLVPFAGIVGDSGEDAPNVRIGVVKRLRRDVGSDRNNAIPWTRAQRVLLRWILTTTTTTTNGFRGFGDWGFGFLVLHRRCSYSERERECVCVCVGVTEREKGKGGKIGGDFETLIALFWGVKWSAVVKGWKWVNSCDVDDSDW